METQFENLARMTRAWANGNAEGHASHGHAREWLALERSMQRQGRALAQRRLVGGSALVVTAIVALMVLRGFGRPDPKLSFVVSEGTASVGGTLRSDRSPARVSFSDGSDVVLNPGARGTVVGTTARGARVRLDAGRARFAVAHRPQTDWSVEAGPFTVIVHGTVFDVGWSEQSGALAVDLLVGSVTIKGPVVGGAVTLRAGQRLTARATTGQANIDQIDESDRGAGRGSASSASAGIPPGDGPASDGVVAPVAATVAPAATAGAVAASGPTRPSRRSSLSTAIADTSSTWASRVASGAFKGVVDEADATGVERCLAEIPAASLQALADAARYVRRTDLARRALLAERRRFVGSVGAHDAAFLIGRLAEDSSGDSREALAWYDRYLGEGEDGEHGTYASEALGRKMMTLDRLGEGAEARIAAERYLELFAGGAFASRARRIQQQR